MVSEAVGSRAEYVGNIICADLAQIPGKIARSTTSTMVIPGSCDPKKPALSNTPDSGRDTEQEP
jgi:hypothetical protein